MCGRYVIKSEASVLAEQLLLADSPSFMPRYNLAPTQQAPVVLDSAPRELATARWGFLPAWAKSPHEASTLFNARSESLVEKDFFREALEHHRCLVPCDGFYEWRHQGRSRTPLYITRASGRLLTLAGLWSRWRSHDGAEVLTFTIITTAANAFMEGIHERMPAVIDEATRGLWLSNTHESSSLLPLLTPWAGEALNALEVSRHVGSVSVDDPRCIEPAAAVQLDLL